MPLSANDYKLAITRVLTDAFASSTVSEKPKVIYIASGQGGGKTSMILHKKQTLKKEEIKAYVIDSDKIAEYHPDYEELIYSKLPDEVYKITREEFVRPATPIIYDELMKNRITIINETVFNKGEKDFEQIKNFKANGYEVEINVIATELLESRLSCYEREAAMLLAEQPPRGSTTKARQIELHNSFVSEIQQIEKMGIFDEINVYIRGENISKPPVLKYSTSMGNSNKYRNFKEAIEIERRVQKEALLANPEAYLARLANARKTIQQCGINPDITANELKGLDELRLDFIAELGKEDIEH